MYDKPNDSPWYLQQSPVFTTLYEGLFPIVSFATPEGISDAFNVENITGAALLQYGQMWGLQGVWGGANTGLIYNIDNWSDYKVWTGEIRDLEGEIYRNFIRMKTFINGRAYNLTTLKEALAILTKGYDTKITIDEGFMNFVINIEADIELLTILYNMSQYDSHFLGKPTGIGYSFNYIRKGISTTGKKTIIAVPEDATIDWLIERNDGTSRIVRGTDAVEYEFNKEHVKAFVNAIGYTAKAGMFNFDVADEIRNVSLSKNVGQIMSVGVMTDSLWITSQTKITFTHINKQDGSTTEKVVNGFIGYSDTFDCRQTKVSFTVEREGYKKYSSDVLEFEVGTGTKGYVVSLEKEQE